MLGEMLERIRADLRDGIINEAQAQQQMAEAYIAYSQEQRQVPVGDPVDTANSVITELLDPGARLPVDYRAKDAEYLAYDNSPEALAELERRAALQEQTVGEKFDDPEYWRRMLMQAGRAPADMYNLATTGLPAMTAAGIDKLAPGSVDVAGYFDDFEQANRTTNEAFNIAEPITPSESLANAAPTAAVVPGGWFAKLLGVGGDFALDQSLREATDTQDTPYQTVFDEAGLTADTDEPLINPMTGIGIILGAGVVGGVGVNTVKAWHSTRPAQTPVLRPVKDVSPRGPDNLDTLETSGDAIKAYAIDEQQVLKDLARRSGVPDIDDIATRIDTEVHSAARTRTQEALNMGHLQTLNATFDTPVAPRVLYNAYNNLQPQQRADVGTYLHLWDTIDDARIALANNQPGNHVAAIAMARRQIAAIEQRTPMARAFHSDYKAITKATRDFMEGGQFSTAFRQRLDAERPNYVPLEMSDVDVDAPLMQRLAQAQKEDVVPRDDWFLKQRVGAAGAGVRKRVDPMDILMRYSEQAILSRMKNDTRLAYIDGLLGSQHGRTTIRKVEADEAEKVQGRTVTVYRDGKQETYVTSNLTADLLQFDPFIAKHPLMFGVKRLNEKMTVGVFQPMFAFTSAMRDTFGGFVTRPEGVTVGNPLQIAAAIPEQLYAQAKGAVSRYMQQSLAGGGEGFVPTSIMATADQKRVADAVSTSYADTLYHAMNSEGGFDASILTSRITAGNNTIRELRRTLVEGSATNPALNNMVTRFGRAGTVALLDGVSALFAAVREAPRYAAVKNTVKKGGSVQDAVTKGRAITGDTSRSGRSYNADGSLIRADAVDQGVTNVVSSGIGRGVGFLQEASPFFNPMVQGTRRLVNSFYDDPFGTQARAWVSVGLPSIAAYGWNELIGGEYNDYAMELRSARDRAMRMYIGIPGLPPEQGIELELPHELMMMSSPLTTTMHGWARGSGVDETSAALQTMTRTIFANSLELGFPTALGLVFNAVGSEPPDALLSGSPAYNIREDNVGFMPENMEKMLRNIFADLGQLSIMTAYGIAEGEGGFEDFLNNAGKKLIVENTPIVRNVTGSKGSNTFFSVPAQYSQQRMNAFSDFRTYYGEFFEPKRFNEDGLEKPASKNYYTASGYPGDEDEDLPFLMIGSEPMAMPTNPLYQEFGEYLVENIARSGMGMSAIEDRMGTYAKIAKQVRRYNAHDKEKLQQWQEQVMAVEAPAEETADLQQLLKDHKIDMTDYYDRVKLVNLIEHKRSELIRMQLSILDQVETEITAQLRADGRLGAADRFDIEKHMRPFDADPLGSGGVTATTSP